MKIAQLTAMAKLQSALNAEVNPEWKSAGNNWFQAIAQEASEAMDHVTWKWWKGEKSDIEQAWIEVVDIVHFALSRSIEIYSGHLDGADPADVWAMVGANTFNFIDRSMAQFKPSFAGHGELDANDPAYKDILNNEFNNIRRLASEAYGATGVDGNNELGEIFISIGKLMVAMDKTIGDLFADYVGKNALNVFRQANGYKSGEYVKIWNGEEDNVHLERWLSEATAGDVNPDSLYNDTITHLEKVYAGVAK